MYRDIHHCIEHHLQTTSACWCIKAPIPLSTIDPWCVMTGLYVLVALLQDNGRRTLLAYGREGNDWVAAGSWQGIWRRSLSGRLFRLACFILLSLACAFQASLLNLACNFKRTCRSINPPLSNSLGGYGSKAARHRWSCHPRLPESCSHATFGSKRNLSVGCPVTTTNFIQNVPGSLCHTYNLHVRR